MRRFISAIGVAIFGTGMLKFIAKRVITLIPVLFGIILFSFLLIRAVPGGPFDFSGGKPLPPEVKAALEARYGLDRPLLLNFPGDGVAPDNGMTMRVSYPALPDCQTLRDTGTAERPRQAVVDTYEGWYLLRMVTERREARLTINNRPVRCLEANTILYSDLTRSQFFEYFLNVLRLDFGLSLNVQTRGVSVSQIIAERLPASVRLGLLVLVVGFVVGIPLGVLTALVARSWFDYGTTFFASALDALPMLVLGPLLRTLFINNWGLLPGPTPLAWRTETIFDPEFASRAVLPVMILGLGLAAGLSRLTRISLLQVLRDDYIRTARAKGMRERIVIYVHALKNALIPVATILGPLIAGLVTGSLITERIFAIPGIGSIFLDSVSGRDYNLLLGVTILYAVFLMIGNMFTDIMYTWLDPRIRFD
jgi:oligopeptide transport system permease protein